MYDTLIHQRRSLIMSRCPVSVRRPVHLALSGYYHARLPTRPIFQLVIWDTGITGPPMESSRVEHGHMLIHSLVVRAVLLLWDECNYLEG